MDNTQTTQKQTKTNQSSDYLKIRGGKPLHGEITVRGAKNSIPKLMVAALLTEEPCTIHNIADIEDVELVSEMIEALGGSVAREGSSITITAQNLADIEPEKLKIIAGKSRIPILFAGPLINRLGTAHVPELGGCKIGPRPVDFHLNSLKKLGAHVEEVTKGYFIRAARLSGTDIHLEYPSVGTTEQILLSAVLADGITELTGAAVEPEIIDLIAVLQKMGAIISVDTDRSITIVGVKKLRGFEHTAITDRLEVASWACAAAATGGEIFVRNARQLDLITFLNKFRQIGGEFDITDEGIAFRRGNTLTSIAIETDVHPGFMTDWQQPFTVLLTQAKGASVVHETVYENRFDYVSALNKMGAHIQLYKECLGSMKCRFGKKNHLHSAVITGPTTLYGAEIEIPDLRAGFSYIVAALTANGISKIHNISIVRRGYEDFLGKLTSLGAEIVE